MDRQLLELFQIVRSNDISVKNTVRIPQRAQTNIQPNGDGPAFNPSPTEFVLQLSP
jgi:flagellar basal body L-ring protein FlgH